MDTTGGASSGGYPLVDLSACGFLVDAHAHLYGEAFREDLREVLNRALEAGVRVVLAVSESLEDAEEILALSERHPNIKPCAGLHPELADPEELGEMISFIRQHSSLIVAIGEVGLDYWVAKDQKAKEIQREILAEQVSLALELGLPLNVHSRSAGRYTIEFLRDLGARYVLLHAFDGKTSAAKLGLDMGYYFSIPPSSVRSAQKQKLIRYLPVDRLLLESDSPVLGPVVGERNEPANIRFALEEICRIKRLKPEDVARITTENARRLFPRAFSG